MHWEPPIKAYTVETFCKSHSIGRTTLYEEIAAGRITPVKVGRRTLIPETESARWLASLPMVSGDTGSYPHGKTLTAHYGRSANRRLRLPPEKLAPKAPDKAEHIADDGRRATDNVD
jgi:excisionase family DNA binding protein